MSKQASLSSKNPARAEEWGDSTVADLIGAIDWSETPLGPASCWPEDLRQVLRAILETPDPRFLWWGEFGLTFYNDAALALLGAAHPQALGQPAEQARFCDGTKIPFNGQTDQSAE